MTGSLPHREGRNAPLLAVRGAALAYRGHRALDGVDLDLHGGEILALLGPNGAGKTSLLRLIAGRLAPDRGTVRVRGGDPRRDPLCRGLVGWVPQDIALYPRLSVRENLEVFARLAGLPRAERARAVARALDRAALEAVAARPVATLSGGYQRRANIAASLVAAPTLLLLDEPTQGVDLAARGAIHAVLSALRAQGTAILISTHDFAEAERLADRVAFVAHGRIVREGRLAHLLRPLAGAPPEHEVLLDAPADSEGETVLRRAGFAPAIEGGGLWRTRSGAASDLDGAALLAALRARNVPAAEIRVRRPGLEALYRDALAPAASLRRSAPLPAEA